MVDFVLKNDAVFKDPSHKEIWEEVPTPGNIYA